MSKRIAGIVANSIFCLTMLVLCLMSSCRSENDFQVNTTDLEGEWYIIEAFRENRKTKLLENGVFSFSDSQYFKTNILRDSNQYKFILSEKIIFVEDSARSRYNVIGFSQDTLTLESTIHDFEFKFVLHKANTNEE